MKLIFTLTFLCCSSLAFSQTRGLPFYANTHPEKIELAKIDLNGQWRGSFNDLTPNQFGIVSKIRIKYVLELKVDGSRVSGYSYTYFEAGIQKYYTICRIIGSFERSRNYLEVTEIERIRYNTPPSWGNCFQTHRLQYQTEGGTEYLVGNWVPAPGQTPGCGHGETLLERHTITRTPFGVRPAPQKKKEVIVQKPPAKPSKPAPKVTPKKSAPPAEDKKTEVITAPIPQQEPEVKMEPGKQPEKLQIPKNKGYEYRTNEISQTIYLTEPVFHIDLYDNGEIDGDSISVFYNGKLILSNKRLSEQPLSLTLHLDNNVKSNIITMYAENLGAIPPNTAVMVVTAGDKRYEVRLESDYGKSGSVEFKLKE